jgi:hypothetical protein
VRTDRITGDKLIGDHFRECRIVATTNVNRQELPILALISLGEFRTLKP